MAAKKKKTQLAAEYLSDRPDLAKAAANAKRNRARRKKAMSREMAKIKKKK